MTKPGLPEDLESEVVALVRKTFHAERTEQPLAPLHGYKEWVLPEDLILLTAGSWPRGTLSVIARELGRSAESCRQRRAFLKKQGLMSEQNIRDFHRSR